MATRTDNPAAPPRHGETDAPSGERRAATGDGPTDRRDVIVYDGQCGFCQKQVTRIRKRDRDSRFEYVPRETPGLDDRFPALAGEDFETGMRLIRRDGRMLAGADAVHEVARQLPRWRWVAWLYRVPGITWLSRRIYAWIAANRHRLAGTCGTDTCRRPGPDE